MSGDSERLAAFDAWLAGQSADVRARLRLIWGKQRGLNQPNPLLQHLLDTMCVADLMWEHYLPLNVKSWLGSPDEGRRSFRWLAGLHDLGKATPAFAGQVPGLVPALERGGLTIGRVRDPGDWRHDLAGATFLRQELRRRWVDPQQVSWLWPIIGGHHGHFYSTKAASMPRVADAAFESRNGVGSWASMRAALLEAVTIAAGFRSVEEAEPLRLPTRGQQLALVGYVMMADWIASGDGFDGVAEPSLAAAMQRAERAWAELGLRGGWGTLPRPPADLADVRFGRTPRPIQRAIVDVCWETTGPPLLIIEAPMGEGKTEVALLAVEVLAHRFGLGGVVIGMPTQATADPMLERMARWLETFASDTELALVHGRSAFNRLWAVMRERREAMLSPSGDRSVEVDEYGEVIDDDLFRLALPRFHDICSDDCRTSDTSDDVVSGTAVASWFLGPHRPMLSPVVISTIDQLLFAAVRSRSAPIRFAGLAGKVVVLDEIHAADEHMTEFIAELLAWLGRAGVPVVLLSATLAARQRERLLAAYRSGACNAVEQVDPNPPALMSYPAITGVWAEDGEPRFEQWKATTSGADKPVALEVIGDDHVVDRIAAEVEPGGCVLVIRNTVDRAQATARALRERFGDEVVLLHSRLTTRERADITERLVEELGPHGDRPQRRIVVATQVAEQSFDVDADLLVTDLAPVDLLLQRIGRLHRHQRRNRAEHLATPRVVIAGVDGATSAHPEFDPGSERIYGRHRLLRALAAVGARVWTVPSEIPVLVERAYSGDPGLPPEWLDDEAAAREAWEHEEKSKAAKAAQWRLSEDGSRTALTLEKLSGVVGAELRDVEHAVRVRSSDNGEEILLVVWDGSRYRTLAGVDLGPAGHLVREIDVLQVVGDTVRLPGFDIGLNEAARHLGCRLDEWHDHPWLSRYNVVVLDEQGASVEPLDGRTLTYGAGVGLTVGDDDEANSRTPPRRGQRSIPCASAMYMRGTPAEQGRPAPCICLQHLGRRVK